MSRFFRNNEDKLHDLVTEWAFSKVVSQVKLKQIRWSFVKTIEPPKVVHVRTTNVISKENIFAQVTVRFHTQQVSKNVYIIYKCNQKVIALSYNRSFLSVKHQKMCISD